MAWVSAAAGAGLTVKYWDENDCYQIYYGGSKSWRNTNPTNIGCGVAGNIGCARFSIFPDEATADSAAAANWATHSYQIATLQNGILLWNGGDATQPPCIHENTGIALATIVSSLTSAQISSVIAAQKICEGWLVGSMGPLVCPYY